MNENELESSNEQMSSINNENPNSNGKQSFNNIILFKKLEKCAD